MKKKQTNKQTNKKQKQKQKKKKTKQQKKHPTHTYTFMPSSVDHDFCNPTDTQV